ncbi:MAG TPA: hypothetical protein VD902_19410 [Symbiobacteriaceae bacterium]|nr:hypothetical protein [Symbiobacteriaceae bacterium]
MRTWLLALLIALSLSGCNTGALPVDACVVKGNAEIDWIDFVKFDGITYSSHSASGGNPLAEDGLGAHYGTVRCRLSGNVSDPGYRAREGDAAFLEAGTPVYRVKGYDPRFRLAARRGQQIVLYEADTNPKARIGADLLDLAGKVAYISVSPPEREIHDPERIQELLKMVLSAPVFPPGERGGAATSGTEVYRVTFHFEDGTATTRSYWPESGFLWAGSGLNMDESFRGTLLED